MAGRRDPGARAKERPNLSLPTFPRNRSSRDDILPADTACGRVTSESNISGNTVLSGSDYNTNAAGMAKLKALHTKRPSSLVGGDTRQSPAKPVKSKANTSVLSRHSTALDGFSSPNKQRVVEETTRMEMLQYTKQSRTHKRIHSARVDLPDADDDCPQLDQDHSPTAASMHMYGLAVSDSPKLPPQQQAYQVMEPQQQHTQAALTSQLAAPGDDHLDGLIRDVAARIIQTYWRNYQQAKMQVHSGQEQEVHPSLPASDCQQVQPGKQSSLPSSKPKSSRHAHSHSSKTHHKSAAHRVLSSAAPPAYNPASGADGPMVETHITQAPSRGSHKVYTISAAAPSVRHSTSALHPTLDTLDVRDAGRAAPQYMSMDGRKLQQLQQGDRGEGWEHAAGCHLQQPPSHDWSHGQPHAGAVHVEPSHQDESAQSREHDGSADDQQHGCSDDGGVLDAPALLRKLASGEGLEGMQDEQVQALLAAIEAARKSNMPAPQDEHSFGPVLHDHHHQQQLEAEGDEQLGQQTVDNSASLGSSGAAVSCYAEGADGSKAGSSAAAGVSQGAGRQARDAYSATGCKRSPGVRDAGAAVHELVAEATLTDASMSSSSGSSQVVSAGVRPVTREKLRLLRQSLGSREAGHRLSGHAAAVITAGQASEPAQQQPTQLGDEAVEVKRASPAHTQHKEAPVSNSHTTLQADTAGPDSAIQAAVPQTVRSPGSTTTPTKSRPCSPAPAGPVTSYVWMSPYSSPASAADAARVVATTPEAPAPSNPAPPLKHGVNHVQSILDMPVAADVPSPHSPPVSPAPAALPTQQAAQQEALNSSLTSEKLSSILSFLDEVEKQSSFASDTPHVADHVRASHSHVSSWSDAPTPARPHTAGAGTASAQQRGSAPPAPAAPAHQHLPPAAHQHQAAEHELASLQHMSASEALLKRIGIADSESSCVSVGDLVAAHSTGQLSEAHSHASLSLAHPMTHERSFGRQSTAAGSVRSSHVGSIGGSLAGGVQGGLGSEQWQHRPPLLAESVYEGVKAKMRRLQQDVADRDATISMLKQQVETIQRQGAVRVEDLQSQARQALAAAHAEHEAALARHLSFMDRLLADKDELNRKVLAVTEASKAQEERHERALSKLKEGWAAEMKRQKEAWQASDRVRREQWQEAKTAEIKELTVKGLEVEVQKLLAKHKAELAAAQQSALDESRRAMDVVAAQQELALRQLREKMSKEQEDLLERERASSQQRVREVSERYEQQLNMQRMRLVADQDLRLEQLEAARREERKRHDEALAAAAAAADERVREVQQEAKAEREALRKAHDKQMEAYREQAGADQEGWRQAVAERARRELCEREAVLVARLHKERDEQIQVVVQRLESEHLSALEGLKADAARREAALKSKQAAVVHEMKRAEARLVEQVQVAVEARQSADTRLAGMESALEAARREADTRGSTIRWLEAQLASAEERGKGEEASRQAAVQHAQQGLMREREALQHQVADLHQQLQQLKMRHTRELEHVEDRVKAALLRKDESLAAALQQVAHLTGQLRQTEAFLANQRAELGAL